MSTRYSPLTRLLKTIYRKWFPIPKSPYTLGAVEDICAVHLVPPDDLQKFFERALKQLRGIRGAHVGDYLEFGVFNGTSLTAMYRATQAIGVTDMRLVGFDSFEGLPADSTQEDDGVWSGGMYSCSFADLKTCLVRERIPEDVITFVPGWYEDSLTEAIRQQLQLKNIGIVMIDCDTYSSATAVLKFIAPLLTQPTIICFDDWKLNDLDIKGLGEYKAFNEFLDQHPTLRVQSIKSYNRKSRAFVVSK